MKYLKYFESSDTELTQDKIKEMFLDISDMDWNVQVIKTSELNQDSSQGSVFTFNYINFFKVRIFKIHTSRRWDIEQKREIENLLNSDIYKETIEVANDRLNDLGWYIDMSTLSTEFSRITFNIYKYENEEI
jgi:hypothetical protein